MLLIYELWYKMWLLMFWDGVIDSIIFVIKLFTLYWMLQCIIFWLRGREKGHLISLLATVALARVELFWRKGEGIFIGNSWTGSSEGNFWRFLRWWLWRKRRLYLWLLREFHKVTASQKPCWEFLAWEQVCRKGRVHDEQDRGWLTNTLIFSFFCPSGPLCRSLRTVWQ